MVKLPSFKNPKTYLSLGIGTLGTVFGIIPLFSGAFSTATVGWSLAGAGGILWAFDVFQGKK